MLQERLSNDAYQCIFYNDTIKGGSRRAEKSCKVLMMMMKVAKLGWVGPAGQEQGWSKARVGLKHEQGRSRE